MHVTHNECFLVLLLLLLLAGHQLHFDSDDEGQGGVRHPIITAIVYLSDNTSPAQHSAADAPKGGSSKAVSQEWVGGPTLMTDQTLGGPLATQGWLAYPATNRVVFFDGRYLHGEHWRCLANAAL